MGRWSSWKRLRKEGFIYEIAEGQGEKRVEDEEETGEERGGAGWMKRSKMRL